MYVCVPVCLYISTKMNECFETLLKVGGGCVGVLVFLYPFECLLHSRHHSTTSLTTTFNTCRHSSTLVLPNPNRKRSSSLQSYTEDGRSITPTLLTISSANFVALMPPFSFGNEIDPTVGGCHTNTSLNSDMNIVTAFKPLNNISLLLSVKRS